MADSPDDLARAIAELRRNSRRFQDEMNAATQALRMPEREARAIAELRQNSHRIQDEMNAARRAIQEREAYRRVLADLRAKTLAMVRSWERDPYFVLLNPRLPLKRRRTAARRIATALKSPIRVTDPAVRGALRDYPASARDPLLRRLLERALLEAAKEVATPLPRIRLGREWVKDKDGRIRRSIAPLDLSDGRLYRWLNQRVGQLIRLDLLGEDRNADRPRRALGLRERADLGIDHRESETMFEYRPTPPPTLRPVVRLSKREREFYELYLGGVSTAEAARRLKVSENTIRVLRFRLRRKRPNL